MERLFARVGVTREVAPGRSTALDSEPRGRATVGKRTLAQDEQPQRGLRNDVGRLHIALARGRSELQSLLAANTELNPSKSCDAAFQLKCTLHEARAACGEHVAPELAELEQAAAPAIAVAFAPSPAAIEEVRTTPDRDQWRKDVSSWRRVCAQIWSQIAAPIAAQLGVDAPIHVNEAPHSYGARGLAQAGHVHLSPDLSPDSATGRHIVAHELVHIAQSRLPVHGSPAEAEREADHLAASLVHGSLPYRPRVGLSPMAAAADVGAKTVSAAPSTAPSPHDPTAAFVIDAKNYRVTARRDWLAQEEGFAKTGRAPEKTFQMLKALQKAGAIAWAKDSALQTLAARPLRHDVDPVVMEIDSHAYEIIGIPPLSTTMVAATDHGLDVITRVEGVPAGHSLPLAAADLDRIADAIASFTGETISGSAHDAFARKQLRTDRGAGVATLVVDDHALRELIGDAGWKRFAERRKSSKLVSRTPISQAHDLTATEVARVLQWGASHLLATAAFATVDRDVLAQIDAIDNDATARDGAYALLRSGRVPSPVTAERLEAVARAARYGQERAELGLATREHRFDNADLDDAPKSELPAQITQHSGLVLDGDRVDFEIVVDYSNLILSEESRKEYVKKGWTVDIEWAFIPQGRGGKPEREVKRYNEQALTIQHQLKLDDCEEARTWEVHAFVRTPQYRPTHLMTLVEVKTVDRRMRELRKDVLGDDALANRMRPDAQGRMSDDAAFSAAPESQRDEERRREEARNDGAATWLASQHDERFHEAIDELRGRNKQLEDDASEIHGEEAKGYVTFDVLATYLSQTDPIPSGNLSIYGTVHHMPTGRGPDVIVVELHDRTRLFGQEDFTFKGFGDTFDVALEAAVKDLAEEYPKGRLALFASKRDATGLKSSAGTIGFERDTYSTAHSVRDHVFHPLAQVAVSALAVATMIVAPEAGVPMLIAMAYSTAASLDDLAHKARNGTLDKLSTSIDLVSIALNVVPMVHTAQPLAELSLFELEVKTPGQAISAISTGGAAAARGIDLVGQVFLMSLQAKQQLQQLQDEDVAAIGQMYAELLEARKTMHASDPRLEKMESEIKMRAADARHRLVDACTNSFGQGFGMMMVHVEPGAASSTRGGHAASGAAPRHAPAWEALGIEYRGHDTFSIPSEHGRVEAKIRRTEGPARVVEENGTVYLEVQKNLTGEAYDRALGDLLVDAHKQLVDDNAPRAPVAKTNGATPSRFAAGREPLHEGGLASEHGFDHYVGEMRSVESQWDTLSQKEKIDSLQGIINRANRTAGLPEVKIKSKALSGSDGYFDFDSWSIVLDNTLLSRPIKAPGLLGKLSNVLIHEARHAEQWFLIARYLTEKGSTAQMIHTRTNIPPKIITEAAKAGAMNSILAKKAEVYFDSVYGANAAHRAQVFLDLEATGNALAAAESNLKKVTNAPNSTPFDKASATASRDAALADAQRAFTAYQALPEETDAWNVGDAAGAKFPSDAQASTNTRSSASPWSIFRRFSYWLLGRNPRSSPPPDSTIPMPT